MRRIISPKIIVLFALAMIYSENAESQSQSPAPLDESAQAKELIRLARRSIGGEEAISRLQTLTASCKYNRFVKYISVQSPKKIEEKQKALSGKMEFEFSLPDKFRRHVTGERLRGFGYSYSQVVNGAEGWRDPPTRPVSSYRDRRVVDVSDVEKTAFRQATSAKQELTYFSIGWLMGALPGYPLETRYLGTYQLGQDKTHAISAEGESGFLFIVLLDSKSYTPLALSISFVEEIQPTIIVEAPGFFDRRYMQETFARARAERRARTAPPQPYELLIRFSDRRLVNGLLLPFRVTTTLNGDVIEEMTINEFEVNRPINPKKFAGPPEPRD